ncbi:hypothetical protein KFK09_022933 [Dendrobium nobile]|uniref:Endoplasmic reticulum transmembrane protein n=1 Tax=Dendrobium nobile TaxID=94219 RepID=A0A8T3AK52_DENNO|nr:hypothetical protein KFK09_022933 [Dendrobium nobile]
MLKGRRIWLNYYLQVKPSNITAPAFQGPACNKISLFRQSGGFFHAINRRQVQKTKSDSFQPPRSTIGEKGDKVIEGEDPVFFYMVSTLKILVGLEGFSGRFVYFFDFWVFGAWRRYTMIRILFTLLMAEGGYSLLLALIIDRLHHYIRELRGLRKSMEAVMKQNRALEEAKSGGSDEIKTRDKEIAKLNEQVQQLETENEKKLKELKAAEANTTALRKQSEGFLIEYDRLLEDNQNLRNQLHSIDLTLSHSDSKKHS